MMFCKMCGEQMDERSGVCTNCGYVREQNPGQNAGQVIGQQGTVNPAGGANYPSGKNQKKRDNYSDGTNANSDNYPNSENDNGINSGETVNGVAGMNPVAEGLGYVPPAPAKKKSKAGCVVLVIVIVLIAVAVLGVGGWFAYSAYKDSKSADEGEKKQEQQAVQPEEQQNSEGEEENPEGEESTEGETEEEKEEPDFEGVVDALISDMDLENDVAVAILDNNNHDVYVCGDYTSQFSSWGFYLPVYMAARDKFSYESSMDNILSNQPATCNAAANSYIDRFGGPASVTGHIQQMGYFDTVVGRKFGDTKAKRDNFTTVGEAASMLNEFNHYYDYRDLCYNEAGFGIAVPRGADFYSQVGTENRDALKCLNLYSIVKGENSDYCIVVLTRNYASDTGIINDILYEVHDLMEGYYE